MSAGRFTASASILACAAAVSVLVGCPLPATGPSNAHSTIQVQRSSAPVTSCDFGNGIVTVSGPTVTFTIVDEGPGTVDLGTNPVRVSGADAADFVVTSQPAASIGSGQSTTFGVQFKPAAAGTRTATISVSPRSGADTVSFSATGTAYSFCVEQGGMPATGFDFGTQTQGVAGSGVSFTIVNKGPAQLTLDPVGFTGTNGSDWSVGSAPASPLDAGSSTTFTLVFTPGSYGARSATVTVSANGGNPSYSFSVTGKGTSGEFALTDGGGNPISAGATFNFGLVKGIATSATFTITNATSESDVLSLVGFTAGSLSGGGGAFAITALPLSSSVAKGSPEQFTISAGAPQNSGLPDGTYTATVTIQTSDANNLVFTFHLTMQYQNSPF